MALTHHSALSTDFSGFINQVACDSTSKECISGKCSKCKDAIDKFAPDNSSSITQWRSVDNRMEKVDNTGTVEKCFLQLKNILLFFNLHINCFHLSMQQTEVYLVRIVQLPGFEATPSLRSDLTRTSQPLWAWSNLLFLRPYPCGDLTF